MIHTADPALDEGPEALDAVGVDVANDVNLRGMLDAPMVVAPPHVREPVIAMQLIGIDGALRQDVLTSQREKCRARNVVDGQSLDAAAPLDDTKNRSLGFVAAHGPAGSVLPLAAHVRFVHLDSAVKRSRVVLKKLANLVEHPPSRLVGHTRLPLNLLRGDAAACRCHQVDSVEPSAERSAGLVKDRASRGMDVMAAAIAGIRAATRHAMMLRDAVALLAEHAIRVKVLTEPFKTSVIVGEHLIEVPESKANHLRLGCLGAFHTYHLGIEYAKHVPTVKG